MNRAPADTTRSTLIWDPLVRAGHWLLVISVLSAWLTRHAPGRWHEWLGYAAWFIVAVRCVWGWIGSPHAPFRDFVRGPRATWSYTRAMLKRQEPASVGHNPLGGWMVVSLLLVLLVVCASGWLYTTDRFWGVAWVDRLHSTSSDVLIALIALHVLGVLYASQRHQENLIGAMIHGRKRIRE